MSEFDVDLFVIGARLRRRARGSDRGRLRRPGHGGGGVPRRRNLRDPRLRAEETHGLCRPLRRRFPRCGRVRLDAFPAPALRLGDPDPQQGQGNRPARGHLPRQPRQGRRRDRGRPGRHRGCPYGPPREDRPTRSRPLHPGRRRARTRPSSRRSPAATWRSRRTRCSISKELPKRILVVGGGYIAVEFAGIFNGLGSEVTLLHRGDKLLRGFDEDVRDALGEAYTQRGIRRGAEPDRRAARHGPPTGSPRPCPTARSSMWTRCWWRPDGGPTPPISGSIRSASPSTRSGRSRSTAIRKPSCRRSTPSAT